MSPDPYAGPYLPQPWWTPAMWLEHLSRERMREDAAVPAALAATWAAFPDTTIAPQTHHNVP